MIIRGDRLTNKLATLLMPMRIISVKTNKNILLATQFCVTAGNTS